MTYGVIDLGSNTNRLVIFEVKESRIESLFSNKNSAGLIVKCKMETADANRKQSIIKNNGKLKKSVAFHCLL